MEVIIEQEADLVIVSVSGTLDSTSSPELTTQSEDWFRMKENKFIINLENLTFISSSGLRIFIFFAKELKRRGGEAVFSQMSSRVRKIFELAGLFDHVFHAFEDINAAKTHLQQN